MCHEISVRRKGGWHSIHWSLIPNTSKIQLVQTRVIGMPGNRFTPSFAQCTFLFRNKQIFAAYDMKGKCVSGSEAEDVNVEDCWVLERLLEKKSLHSRWRLAARLG